jgi:hypothetical protein
MVHIFEAIDNTLHSQLARVVEMNKPKIVLNMEFSTSWTSSTPNTILKIQDACLEQGGDLIVANASWDLQDEIRQIDKLGKLKFANSLGQAEKYFRNY